MKPRWEGAHRATGGQGEPGTPAPYRPATFCGQAGEVISDPRPGARRRGRRRAAVIAAGWATGWPQRSRRGFAHRADTRFYGVLNPPDRSTAGFRSLAGTEGQAPMGLHFLHNQVRLRSKSRGAVATSARAHTLKSRVGPDARPDDQVWSSTGHPRRWWVPRETGSVIRSCPRFLGSRLGGR
jgi:hypothetical protein